MSEPLIPSSHFDRIQPMECVNAKLRRLHRLLNSAYQAKIRPFGLQGSMLSMMFIIGKNKGIHQKALADALVLDQSTVSRDLNKLVKKGWVYTWRGDDPRQSHLAVTEQGRALLEEVTPVWEALHLKVQALLGSFHIQQIDAMSKAVQGALDQLNE